MNNIAFRYLIKRYQRPKTRSRPFRDSSTALTYTDNNPNISPRLVPMMEAAPPADMATLDTRIASLAPSGLNDASIANGNVTNGVRRSARLSTTPLANDEDLKVRLLELKASSSELKISKSENETPSSGDRMQTRSKKTPRATRRKRKAAVEVPETPFSPEEVVSLQEEIFSHMDVDERKEYRGWVELESEPGFFNAMLQDLGAKAFKVQEVFSLDPETMTGLPQPVYGLIFLYECGEDAQWEDRENGPDSLWFANQTTTNACATVAVMNIIMNAPPTVKLGPELEAFREATRSLPPPHRGHALNNNDFIRAVHNSVARRIDLLSEDLLLDMDSNLSFEKFETASKTAAKKKQAAKSKKQGYGPNSYHYIAFVPVDGEVWELDGLQSQPLGHGSFNPDKKGDWLNIAGEAIEYHMENYADELISYNLLAICQSPLTTLSHDIATNLASAKALDDIVSHNPSWDVVTLWRDISDDKLASFNLTRERICADFRPDMSRTAGVPEICAVTARAWAEELRAEQESLEARYAAETAAVADTVTMIHDRRRDYTPAIHEWVRILAEKGVLRELIQEMNSSG